MPDHIPLLQLLDEVAACHACDAHLPLGPRPVVQAGAGARLLIVGQAPGTRVHNTGIPWNDASGDRLRNWLQMDRQVFYDPERIAIVPMGLCYPGRGKSGDLPPRPECAPLWHARLLEQLPHVELTLLVGSYAQRYYLHDGYRTLTERVRNWRDFAPRYFPLVHPSPRNQFWLTSNPWFEQDLLPALRERVWQILGRP